jgi:hypothetical protein
VKLVDGMADAADTSALFWQSRPRLPAIRQRNAEHFSSPQTTTSKAEEWELSAGHEGRLSPVKYAQARDFREAGKSSTTYGRSWRASAAKLRSTQYRVSNYGLKMSEL